MIFDTCFNCGDTAWIFYGRYHEGVQEATIGQIRIEHTDTVLYEDDETGYGEITFSHKESYMCEETGVGTGTLFTLGENIFKTENECKAKFAKEIAKKEQEKIDKVEAEKKRKLGQEKLLRMQLAEIEMLKGEM